MTTFADRLRMVIGPSQAPYGWAKAHGLAPPKVWDWLKNDRQPRLPYLQDLAQRTGIPLEWWLKGEGPPPRAEHAEAPGVTAIAAGQLVETDELRKLIAHVDRFERDLRAQGVVIDPDLKADIVAMIWHRISRTGYDASYVDRVLKVAIS